ncbi:MAG: hypothetical protein ACREPQ_00835 [Rhodanobacter sp.]
MLEPITAAADASHLTKHVAHDQALDTYDRVAAKFASARDFLSALLQTRLLDTATASWKELVHDSEDAFNYLSLSMVVPDYGITTMATIEFGVRDTDQRHAVGILLADWHHDDGRLGPIQVMTLDGEATDIATFTAKLRRLLNLPATFVDSADAGDE